MLTPSTFANILTGLRAVVALLLPVFGALQGREALASSVYLMLVAWVSDYFDGTLARRHSSHRPSWLGAHDLQVDLLVAMGLLLYLLQSGYVSTLFALGYVVAWMLALRRFGMDKTTGSLLQGPIYGIFLWIAAQDAPAAALWVPAWVVVVLSISWRRFLGQVLPEFFAGLGRLLRR